MKLNGRWQEYRKNLVMKIYRKLHDKICQFYDDIVEFVGWVF